VPEGVAKERLALEGFGAGSQLSFNGFDHQRIGNSSQVRAYTGASGNRKSGESRSSEYNPGSISGGDLWQSLSEVFVDVHFPGYAVHAIPSCLRIFIHVAVRPGITAASMISGVRQKGYNAYNRGRHNIE
jgi:hypothetical protein